MIKPWIPLNDLPIDQRASGLVQSINAEFSKKSARVQFQFFQDDVTASQTGVVLDISGYIVKERLLLRDAFIIGVGVYSSSARTAGTCTVVPTINGTAIASTAVLNGTNTQTKTTIFAPVKANFAAEGSRIGAKVTTDAGWLPITAGIIVEVLLLYTGED